MSDFATSKLILWDFKDKHKQTNISNQHFLLRESLLCLFNQIKSTFELVQEGFRHPIISRYLTHSYVTEILILDSGLRSMAQISCLNPGTRNKKYLSDLCFNM